MGDSCLYVRVMSQRWKIILILSSWLISFLHIFSCSWNPKWESHRRCQSYHSSKVIFTAQRSQTGKEGVVCLFLPLPFSLYCMTRATQSQALNIYLYSSTGCLCTDLSHAYHGLSKETESSIASLASTKEVCPWSGRSALCIVVHLSKRSHGRQIRRLIVKQLSFRNRRWYPEKSRRRNRHIWFPRWRFKHWYVITIRFTSRQLLTGNQILTKPMNTALYARVGSTSFSSQSMSGKRRWHEITYI